ncbi:MAG: hypothetical protein LBV43_00300 [Prevotella sp.]|nr:hypothetical protein [Prevotella sp.]
MNREDTAAIPWMAKYERNPYPDKIVWRQEEVVLPFFYWLGVSKDEAKPGMRVTVSRSNNNITILENDYKELTLFLNDKMFDLDNPIIIIYKDREIFNNKVDRTKQNIQESLHDRKDIRYIFPSKLTIRNNSDVD